MLVVALVGCILAPAPAPVATQDSHDAGPFHFERRVALQWPGLAMPAFTLIADRRWVHTFSLGFNTPGLRAFSLRIVTVEPSYDATLRAQSVARHSRAAEGSFALDGGVALPHNLRLSIGGTPSRAGQRAASVLRGATGFVGTRM